MAVKHSTHHPKVKASSPAIHANEGRENMVITEVFGENM